MCARFLGIVLITPLSLFFKVARVRNKWKCILKDGMIHINGKDYLFSKCTGYVGIPTLIFVPAAESLLREFEW
jgi:uncharacterized membrane protein YecN with MAPEG domain